jgi:hypothetical protein
MYAQIWYRITDFTGETASLLASLSGFLELLSVISYLRAYRQDRQPAAFGRTGG